MTRAQRNAVAEVIVASLHERPAADALRALGDVLAATDPVAVDRVAATRLVAAGIVVAMPRETVAGTAPATTTVALAPAFAGARAEVRARVARACSASDIYWRAHDGRRPADVRDGIPVRHEAMLGEAELDAGLRRGAALFEARLYFEVHEELEALWNRARGTTRVIVQGLLQIAVALHHAERGNVAGARRLLAAGRAKVEPYAPTWRGIALATLLAELDHFEAARLDRGEPVPAPRLMIT
jgi:hypothetical protein